MRLLTLFHQDTLKTLSFLAILVSSSLGPSVSLAQGFGAALAAYLSGATDDATEQMHVLAAAGNVDALLFLAEDAQSNIFLSDANERAVEYYERAAAQGASYAQRRLGEIYSHRAEETADADDRHALFSIARTWYQQAATGGNIQAAFALAQLLQNSQGDPADPTEVLRLLTQAAEADHPGADRELGLLHLQQNNFSDAIMWLQPAAEGGDPHAQAILSKMYLLGIGVEQSDERSLHWLEQAATSGHQTAQRDLAVRYWSGVGVPQDRPRAITLLRAAAENGNVLAQLNLGAMHYRGLGVSQDYALAREYFAAAAEAGSSEAQFSLAQMVQLAQGGPSLGLSQNYLQAMDLFLSAARQGYLPAQLELARLYETGIVRFRDQEKALFWYQAAAQNGDEIAAAAAAVMLSEGRGVARFIDGPVSHFGHLSQVLFIAGEFRNGDGERVSEAIDKFQPKIVVLDSPGGIVAEAIRVADLIHEREISTYIPVGAECLSACVYVFSSGKKRIAQGELGVHQLKPAEDNAVVPLGDFQAIISQILSAMNRYNVPYFLTERILSSSDMYFLTELERVQVSRGEVEDFENLNLQLIESVLAYQFSSDRGDSEGGVAANNEIADSPNSDVLFFGEQVNRFLGSNVNAPAPSEDLLVRGEQLTNIDEVANQTCEPSASHTRRLFSRSATKEHYISFIEENAGCPALSRFAEAAILLRDSDDQSGIGNESTEASLQLTAESRAEIQKNLQILGFYSGPLDGIFGAGTRLAISGFSEYSTGLASRYFSMATLNHLRLMSDVVPEDGTWRIEISRENTRNPSDNRIVGTVQVFVRSGEVSNYQVINGRGTRLIVNDVQINERRELNIIFDGYYLVRTPSVSERIMASVPFSERQIIGLVRKSGIGSFDESYRAVLTLQRVGL